MRTLTWDYDTNTVTEWCRMGDCNYCGECCEVMIYLRVTGECFNGDARDGGDSVSEKGVWHEWNNGERHFWQIDKIAHDEPCKCYNLYVLPFQSFQGCEDGCLGIRHELCTAWPLHPDHVECFDNCSYRFVKLNEWEITMDKQEIIE